ncbi:MAG: type II toxin-antitoxin system RelE/ParE family toxin [Coriobacteriia bacterium]|nr:type II toxin-antitoxin system RelE/ParE family toxin [Coriobacteriia bacterium]
MKVDWTDLALDRVDEIGRHIAEDNLDAAVRWTTGLFDAADRLSKFPESGRMVPELEEREVRELVYGAYRVFYQVGDSIKVLSVRHGSQLIRDEDVGGD